MLFSNCTHVFYKVPILIHGQAYAYLGNIGNTKTAMNLKRLQCLSNSTFLYNIKRTTLKQGIIQEPWPKYIINLFTVFKYEQAYES